MSKSVINSILAAIWYLLLTAVYKPQSTTDTLLIVIAFVMFWNTLNTSDFTNKRNSVNKK